MPARVELQHGDNCRCVGPELAPWTHQFVTLLQRSAEVPDLPAVGSTASPALALAFAPPPLKAVDERSEWWRVFLDAPDSHAGCCARQKLLESYWPLVKSIVGSLCRHWPIDGSAGLGMGMESSSGQLSREDLQQEGMLGLMTALDQFDPRRGINFAHFARLKIRGAALDAVRRWWRTTSAASAPAPGHPPSAMPMALYYNRPYDFDAVEFADLMTVLTVGLDSRQQTVTRLWLEQQMSMAQIAAKLKLHISRVGQIRRGLIVRWQADPRLRALLP